MQKVNQAPVLTLEMLESVLQFAPVLLSVLESGASAPESVADWARTSVADWAPVSVVVETQSLPPIL